jgi:hypothetical protein
MGKRTDTGQRNSRYHAEVEQGVVDISLLSFVIVDVDFRRLASPEKGTNHFFCGINNDNSWLLFK